MNTEQIRQMMHIVQMTGNHHLITRYLHIEKNMTLEASVEKALIMAELYDCGYHWNKTSDTFMPDGGNDNE